MFVRCPLSPPSGPPSGRAGTNGSILFAAAATDAACTAFAAAAEGELRSACGGSKLDSASLSFSNKIESTGNDSFDRLKRFVLLKSTYASFFHKLDHSI